MRRTKIDYGIDLGTTNSAISRMENGEAVIRKSEEGFQMDTTPSCMHFNKSTVTVGSKASNLLERGKFHYQKMINQLLMAFQEFKRTMGTDESYDSNMEKTFSSEELSSEVLKALKGYIRDEEVNAAVITVQQSFRDIKMMQHKRQLKWLGLKKSIFIAEPVAASWLWNRFKFDGWSMACI